MQNIIELHQSLLGEKLRRVVQRIVPQPGTPSLSLKVASGLHQDANIDIAANAFSIGTASECDVVLLDDGIADVHANATVKSSLLGNVLQVKALHDGVRLNGKAIQKDQSSSFETVPLDFSINGINVLITANGTSREQDILDMNDRFIRVCLSALFFFAVLFSIDVVASSAERPVQSAMPTQALQTDPEPKPSVKAELEAKIDGAGLSDLLTLQQTPDNTLNVSGSLPVEKMTEWKKIHSWFDGHSNEILLTSQVRIAPVLDDFPALASVRLGPEPSVRLLSGKVFQVGDRVHGPWIIEDIAQDNIRIRNGQDTLKVNF